MEKIYIEIILLFNQFFEYTLIFQYLELNWKSPN